MTVTDLDMAMLREQAQVHDHQDCCGLPFCVSCRTAVLIKKGIDIEATEKWINEQPEGTIIRLERT